MEQKEGHRMGRSAVKHLSSTHNMAATLMKLSSGYLDKTKAVAIPACLGRSIRGPSLC